MKMLIQKFRTHPWMPTAVKNLLALNGYTAEVVPMNPRGWAWEVFRISTGARVGQITNNAPLANWERFVREADSYGWKP